MCAVDLSDELLGCQFGDARLNKQASKIAHHLGRKPNVRIPAAMKTRADLEACYRFFDNENVTPAKILEPHIKITYQCGEGLLALRRHRIKLLRGRKLKARKELAGKRVSVQIDGGRMKIRGEMMPKTATVESTDTDGLITGDAPGRSKKRPRRTFAGDWREPKLMTIFVHDEHGKMLKETKATIDGTLLGPDAIAEVVAMHLHRLGATGCG